MINNVTQTKLAFTLNDEDLAEKVILLQETYFHKKLYSLFFDFYSIYKKLFSLNWKRELLICGFVLYLRVISSNTDPKPAIYFFWLESV